MRQRGERLRGGHQAVNKGFAARLARALREMRDARHALDWKIWNEQFGKPKKPRKRKP